MIDILAISSIWLHPLGQCAGDTAEIARCKSYNWYSGLGADFGEITLVGSLGALIAIYRQHNCKATWWCPFWMHHKVDGTSASVCHLHHTEDMHRKMQARHRVRHPNRLAHGESPKAE